MIYRLIMINVFKLPFNFNTSAVILCIFMCFQVPSNALGCSLLTPCLTYFPHRGRLEVGLSSVTLFTSGLYGCEVRLLLYTRCSARLALLPSRLNCLKPSNKSVLTRHPGSYTKKNLLELSQ